MRGLIIREPWIDFILEGCKTWEMRSKPTHIRGPIALIRAGASMVVGIAELTDCRPPLDRRSYMSFVDRHAIPESTLELALMKQWIHPWVLSDVRPLAEPVRFQAKSGPVIFVNLDAAVAEAVLNQTSDHRPEPNLRIDTAHPRGRHAKAPVSAPTTRGIPVMPIEPSTTPVFVFRPEAAQAHGQPDEGGSFVVLAGSTAMRHGSPRVKRDLSDRDELVQAGILVPDADAKLYRFAINHRFSSASKATGVIKNGNASGPSLWIGTKTGQTLKAFLVSR